MTKHIFLMSQPLPKQVPYPSYRLSVKTRFDPTVSTLFFDAHFNAICFAFETKHLPFVQSLLFFVMLQL